MRCKSYQCAKKRRKNNGVTNAGLTAQLNFCKSYEEGNVSHRCTEHVEDINSKLNHVFYTYKMPSGTRLRYLVESGSFTRVRITLPLWENASNSAPIRMQLGSISEINIHTE